MDNNIIHAIGGYSNSYHLIWINDNHNKIYSFSSKPIGNRKKDEPLYGHSLIVLNSLKQILILGGKSSTIWGGYLNDIWVCQCQSPHKPDDIKWTKLNNTTMPHKIEGFGMFFFMFISIYISITFYCLHCFE